MNRYVVAGALTLALALPAAAAPGSTPPGSTPSDAAAPAPSGSPPSSPAASTIEVTSASDLANRFVYDKDGHDAGWAQYLMIDARTGDIGYLVIGSDAGFDIGNKLIAVPWTLATDPRLWGDRSIVLQTTVDKLRQAPRLDRSELGTLTEPVAMRRVTDYYAPASGVGADAGSSGSSSPGHASGSATADPYFLVGQSVVEAIVPDPVTRAKALADADVRSADGKMLGRIDRVVVDVPHGRVAYLLMTRGDVLGLGGEWVPIPLEALAWSPQDRDFVLRADPQKLREMRGFPKQELPARVSAAQLDDLYRSFGLPPYRPGAAAKPPAGGPNGTRL